MQDGDLLMKHPPDKKLWFNQNGQVGQVLDRLLDSFLELHHIYARRVVQAKEMGPGITRALIAEVRALKLRQSASSRR